MNESTPLIQGRAPKSYQDSEAHPVVANEDDQSLDAIYDKYNKSLSKLPILTSLWLGSFLSSIDTTIVSNIMPELSNQFHESEKKQWIATSYLLTNVVFQPLFGKLSDIIGRKSSLLIAQGFFALGCLVTVFANSVETFSLGRAVCGIGGGGINAMSSITVSDICETKERGVYQGYANIVYGAGQLLGPLLGGVLLDTIGWRIIFAIQIILMLACMMLAMRHVNIKLAHLLPKNKRFTSDNMFRINIMGSLLLAGVLTCILIICAGTVHAYGFSIAMVIFSILFYINEKYFAVESFFPRDLMNKELIVLSLTTVLGSFIMFGDIYRSPVYLQVVQDISVIKTGLFLLAPPLAVAGGSVVTGHILRHTKLSIKSCTFILLMIAMVMQMAATSLQAKLIDIIKPNIGHVSTQDYIFHHSGMLWRYLYVSFSVLVSFSYAIILVSTLVCLVDMVPKSKQGTLTGTFYLWRSIGNVLGASLTLTVYEKVLASYVKKLLSAEDAAKLLHDSKYLREGKFDTNTIRTLLENYKAAMVTSYYPCILLGVVGSLLCGYFCVNRASQKS